MKNKKGALMFAPILLILLVIGLIYAYSLISAKYKQFNKEIGEKQFELINTYQKGEKSLFYIDQSAKYSSYQGIYDLAKKGGCSNGNEYSGYRLWDVDNLGLSVCFPTGQNAKSGFLNFFPNTFNNYINGYSALNSPPNNYDLSFDGTTLLGNARGPINMPVIDSASGAQRGTYSIKASFKVNIGNYDFSDYDLLRLKSQELISTCNKRSPFICLNENIQPPPLSGVVSCPIENPTISCGSLGSGHPTCEHCDSSYRSREYYDRLCNDFPRTADGIDVQGPDGLDTYSAKLPYINGQVVQWMYDRVEHCGGSNGAGKTFTATDVATGDTYQMYITHLDCGGPGSTGQSFPSGTIAGNLYDDIDGEGKGHTHIQIIKNGERVRKPEIELGMCSSAPVVPGQVDMLDYYLPGRDVTIYMDNGEVFNVQPSTIKGRTGFYIIKNQAGNNFEEFTYDDNAIYHLRDTTWINTCNGHEAYFTYLNGRFDNPRRAYEEDPTREGGRWVKRLMNVGEVDNIELTVVGFDETTCLTCDAPYTGPGGMSMKLVSVGPWREFGDVARLTTIAGIGAGESYYIAKNFGWVGYELRSGDQVDGNVVRSAYARSAEVGQRLTVNHICKDR